MTCVALVEALDGVRRLRALCQPGELSRRYGVAAGNRIHKLVCASASRQVLMALTGLCAQTSSFRQRSSQERFMLAASDPNACMQIYGARRNAFYPWTPAPYPAEERLMFRRVRCAPTTHEKASLQSTDWSRAAKPHATSPACLSRK